MSSPRGEKRFHFVFTRWCLELVAQQLADLRCHMFFASAHRQTEHLQEKGEGVLKICCAFEPVRGADPEVVFRISCDTWNEVQVSRK